MCALLIDYIKKTEKRKLLREPFSTCELPNWSVALKNMNLRKPSDEFSQSSSSSSDFKYEVLDPKFEEIKFK